MWIFEMKTFLIQNEIDNEFIRLEDIKNGRRNIMLYQCFKIIHSPKHKPPQIWFFSKRIAIISYVRR